MRIILPLLLLPFILMACQPGQQNTEEEPEESILPADSLNLPEGFVEFYERFHTDSAFQMDHILFPLMGLPSNADTIENLKNFRHKREDWILHKPFNDPFGDYEREYAVPGKDIVIERFVIPRARLYMERRFAKMDGEWQLIYYANVNRMSAQ